MILPISPRITKPSTSSDETYHSRSNNKSRVNTIRLSYEKDNQLSSARRLSSGSGGSGRRLSSNNSSMNSNCNNIGGSSRRFVPNVNSPTWRSLQSVMKSKVGSISSPRHYASSPRHSALAKYKMSSPSPRGRGGSGFFVDNNKVSSTASSSTQQQHIGVGGVDSYSLTAASTNSVDELEMKFSGGSLEEEEKQTRDEEKDSRHCNKAEARESDCNKVERRDEQEVVEDTKVSGKDDGEVRDVSLVEMRGVTEQSKEEVSFVCE